MIHDTADAVEAKKGMHTRYLILLRPLTTLTAQRSPSPVPPWRKSWS